MGYPLYLGALGVSFFLKFTNQHFESKAWGKIGYSDANRHKGYCVKWISIDFVCFNYVDYYLLQWAIPENIHTQPRTASMF